MSAVDRHERVRADWLLAHESHWHLSDRRMANELKRRAAQKSNKESGAADSSFHEGKIKPLHARFLAGGEDSKDRMARGLFLVLLIVPAVAVTAGPALAFSNLAYGAATESVLKRGGVPRAKPWLFAAAAAAMVGVLAGLLFRSLITVATVHLYPAVSITVDAAHVGLVYSWVQLTLGLLLTAWQIRRHGWPGVVIKGTPKVPQSGKRAIPTVPAREEDAAAPAAEEVAEGKGAAKAPAVPTRTAVPARAVQADLPEEEPEYDDEPEFDDAVFIEDGRATTN